jgi:hypothetical protein
MEAFACKEGLEFARQLMWCAKSSSWNRLLGVFQVVEAGGDAAFDDHVCCKRWRKLVAPFRVFFISYVGRECNRVAHGVPRQVSSTTRFGVWYHETPTYVQELLEQDCNHNFWWMELPFSQKKKSISTSASTSRPQIYAAAVPHRLAPAHPQVTSTRSGMILPALRSPSNLYTRSLIPFSSNTQLI